MKQKRNTIQRAIVLNAVKDLHNHPTSDEVYNHISKQYPSIGRSTVFRNLNSLCDEGLLLLVRNPIGADHVDDTISPHSHVICKRCGKVIDIDLDYHDNLMNYISNSYGYDIENYELVFTGICPMCKD